MPRLCLASPASLFLCEFVCVFKDMCVYETFINERTMKAYMNTGRGTIDFANVLPYFTCHYF